GSHGMPASDYPELPARVADGILDPARLIRERIGLAHAGARLAALGEPGAGAGGMTMIRPDLTRQLAGSGTRGAQEAHEVQGT
ncbi:MAG TPA: hypothetical protein PL137_01990, partial [Nocardioides sp.]|nr:hypothetical protein [Nocardioides sp.]